MKILMLLLMVGLLAFSAGCSEEEASSKNAKVSATSTPLVDKDEDKDKVCREKHGFYKACEQYGRCVRSGSTTGGTVCHAAKDEDCRASTVACKEQGRCAASGKKGAVDCIVGSDEDCASSEDCKKSGLCAKKGNKCVATKADHCRQSQKCKDESICHLGEDSCFNVHMGNR